MIYFRACRRCTGDIHMSRDTFGAYFKCLQCGFSRDIPTPQERAEIAETVARLAPRVEAPAA